MPKAHVNGININYKVNGEGEPLVLIMGFAGPGSAWFFQTRAFKKHYRVVTFDNRDALFGKTDSTGEAYTIKTMADDTIGLMDHLGIDRAHILGYSMGGMIAQEIAINYPERVRRLILASTISSASQLAPELLGRFGLDEDSSEEDLRSVDVKETLGSLAALAFNSRLYRIVIARTFPIFSRLGGIKGLKGQVEAVAGCDTLDRLQTIGAQTLVIVGTEDKVTSPSGSEVIAGRIPNAGLVKVEGGSHAYAFEMRGRFNREVLNFLRDS
ncbi:alpha/beta fold hydrolase [Chloroflexota bacterium]